MTPERWQQVKLLFNRAMECEPAARAAFLTEHGGEDLELRREVESLLASADESGRTLQTPAARLTGDFPEEDGAAAMVGQHVGPYRLVREIGWGGMGTVYEAVRADEAFRKRVAIKVVRREMATQLVLRRFRHERQILAELNHPNIASLLDGGVTSDGRPFFAMEYIEGQPIDEYCKARSLSVRERVALFLEVCDAVQYAHRSLVVHRDLKPSNILVTESGQPKLLDFGIAKLLDDGAAGAAQLTHAGELFLTPDYACPEQVRGGPITTASDVYSLGIILYELLAGERPYRTEGRPLQEIVRAITEEEPVRPSTLARQRLSGELDSIVLKAIRKEPERRYLSVEQLAEDLRRHLDGRPVLAQSGTAMYRLWKFVRRHTAAVSAMALVIVTLAGGIIATLTQARRAEAERERAEARFNDVRGLANSVLFEIHDALAQVPGGTATRALLISRGVEYLDRLSRQSRNDPTLEREIADAYLRLGRVQGLPTASNLGDLAAARTSYLRALSIGERLLQADPKDRVARRTVALAHEKLSDVEGHLGDLTAAVMRARAALRTWEELSEGNTSSVAAMLPVAISYIKLGDVLGGPGGPNIDEDVGAMAAYQRSLSILDALPSGSGRDRTVRRYIALLHERIGEMHLEFEHDAEAVVSFEKSFAIRRALSNEAPSDQVALRDVGVSHEKICSVHIQHGDARIGTPHCRQSLEIYRRLYENDRDDTFALTTLAIGHDWLHRALAAQGDLNGALVEMERATGLFRELLGRQEHSVSARRHYARSLLKLGSLHARMPGADHRRRAEIAYEQGRAGLEALRRNGTVNAEDEEHLRDAAARLGTTGAERRSIP
jgi:serine/threonine protein kinase